MNDIAQQLSNLLPPSLGVMRGELEKNFQAVLQAQLGKLNLVSRDAFEAQRALLQAAQQQLQALDARVKQLESA